MRDLFPAIALLIGTGAMLLGLSARPSAGRDRYVVVAPLWYDLGRTAALVDAAGGQIVAPGDAANIAIVHSEHRDFVDALYGAGAWLVVDPVRLGGCLRSPATTATAPWRA